MLKPFLQKIFNLLKREDKSQQRHAVASDDLLVAEKDAGNSEGQRQGSELVKSDAISVENIDANQTGEQSTGLKLSGLSGGQELSTDLGHACSNCGTFIQGEFCAHCGQRDRDIRRPIWVFLYDVFDEALALDGRIVNTMGPLLFLPGKMTNDFVDGKRARFVPPIRLYLFCSIFFFLVVSLSDIAIINFEWTENAQTQANSKVSDDVKKDLENRGIRVTFDDDIDKIMDQPKTEEERLARIEKLAEEIAAIREEMLLVARAGGARDHTPTEADEGQEAGTPVPKQAMRELRIELASKARELAELQGYNKTESDDDYTWDDEALLAAVKGMERYTLNSDMFVAYDETKEHIVPPKEQFDGYKRWTEKIKEDEDSTETELKIANFGEKVIDGFYLASQDPRRLNNTLNDWVQRALLLLLPFFALLLRFFYWSKRSMLVRQLVFSLHFHSYIFLVLAFLLIAQTVVGSAVSAWMFLAAVPLYLFIGLKVISQNGIIRTFFKFFMISFIYMLVLTMSVAMAVLMGLAEL